MGIFDFFAAPLRCPNCGQLSPADQSTDMQTKIRDRPNMELISVGDQIDATIQNLQDAGYWPLREPEEPVKILQSWECPSCWTPQNWALITVNHGCIISIVPVAMNRASFETAHLACDDIVDVAAGLEEVKSRELPPDRESILDIIRRKL